MTKRDIVLNGCLLLTGVTLVCFGVFLHYPGGIEKEILAIGIGFTAIACYEILRDARKGGAR